MKFKILLDNRKTKFEDKNEVKKIFIFNFKMKEKVKFETPLKMV